MSIVRLVVAWLLMAALPLQGLAAASMLFCGPGVPAAVAGVDAADHHGHGHAAEGHERGHEGMSDPGAHVHADARSHAHEHSHANVHDRPAPAVDAVDAVDAADHSAHHDSADASPTCPICASCCNATAITQAVFVPHSFEQPTALPSPPAALILTRASPRPDKPPRA
ncbi:hypothetical protein [Ramlibacter sp.]|uniref:hypothetical protein n=1 Tax=Ramlibacter sp. TaxID=1917967 RepID=UPI003D0CAA7A